MVKYFIFGLLLACSIGLSRGAWLEWDRNPETNVVGYNVYTGAVSRVYGPAINMGNVTTASVSTHAGMTYFAVTAYDSDGLESDYSAEVFYRKLSNPGGLPNHALTNVTLRVPSGKFYVERGDTTTAWAALPTVIGPTNISFPITGTMGFYRYRPYFVSFANPKGGAAKLIAVKNPMFKATVKPRPVSPTTNAPSIDASRVNLDPSKAPR